MVIQGTWAILNISKTSLICTCTNTTHPPCLQQKGGPKRLKHFIVPFLTLYRLDWPQKSYQSLAPYKSEPYKAWLIPFCLYRQFNFRVSASWTKLSKLEETRSPEVGKPGGKLTQWVSMGSFTTFSLKAYEVLVEKPDSNRHYLGYMINISWAELRVNSESQEDKARILCWFSWGLHSFVGFFWCFVFVFFSFKVAVIKIEWHLGQFPWFIYRSDPEAKHPQINSGQDGTWGRIFNNLRPYISPTL